MSNYNVGLKTLVLQGLSKAEFYGDLMYKFKHIIGKNDFPYQFKKIIVRYNKWLQHRFLQAFMGKMIFLIISKR